MLGACVDLERYPLLQPEAGTWDDVSGGKIYMSHSLLETYQIRTLKVVKLILYSSQKSTKHWCPNIGSS